MRTNSEHASSKIRAVGRLISRSLSAGIARVRCVLTRVRGGLSHRHLAEVSICASAAPRRVYPEKAARKLGLPMEVQDVTDRVRSLRRGEAFVRIIRDFQKNTSLRAVRRSDPDLDWRRNPPSSTALMECAALIPPYEFIRAGQTGNGRYRPCASTPPYMLAARRLT